MMEISFALIVNSVLLGVGLAMDAFSVSLANGLNEPKMKIGRMFFIAGTFGLFQFAMPMTGWFLVHAAAQKFTAFQKYIPWIALLLLLYIGGKMLIEGIKESRESKKNSSIENAKQNKNEIYDNDEKFGASKVGFAELMLQGVATSIDALSVGFTIASYSVSSAFASTAIIGVVTLAICIAGLILGKTFGTKLAGKSSILGGAILIAIGFEIWISGVFL